VTSRDIINTVWQCAFEGFKGSAADQNNTAVAFGLASKVGLIVWQAPRLHTTFSNTPLIINRRNQTNHDRSTNGRI
jgi:hypothetical protein